jgi:hypothetical protein
MLNNWLNLVLHMVTQWLFSNIACRMFDTYCEFPQKQKCALYAMAIVGEEMGEPYDLLGETGCEAYSVDEISKRSQERMPKLVVI